MKTIGALFVTLAVGLVCSMSWAAAPAGQYTSRSGTVKDNLSGLTWQQGYSDTVKIWSDAVAYCSALSLGGYSSGWRLPAFFELATLVDVHAALPSIDTTAFSSPSEPFWTSTHGYLLDSAWYIEFSRGFSNLGSRAGPNAVSYRFWVRCVR